jgi:hypothetical protein
VPEANSTAEEQRVRAPFLRFLLLGGGEQAPVHERGVQLAGAWIEGVLDLAGGRIPFNASLWHCRFTELLIAQDTRVAGLVTLDGSHLLEGMNADRIQCDGGLFLRNGFKATGTVRLIGAEISVSLDCSNGHFESSDGEAIIADRLSANGGVFLKKGIQVIGTVSLSGAKIGGNLDCSSGNFKGNDGLALSANRVAVTGSVFLNKSFRANG